MESLAPLIAASINAGTPLLLAALGLLMNERAGVLNLGAEGMMLVAAVAGFMVGYQTQIPLLGFAAGALAGMVMAALFAWLALVLVTSRSPPASPCRSSAPGCRPSWASALSACRCRCRRTAFRG